MTRTPSIAAVLQRVYRDPWAASLMNNRADAIAVLVLRAARHGRWFVFSSTRAAA